MIPSLAASRLRTLYDAAIGAARPGPATRDAVERLTLGGTARCWLVALGKAAPAMMDGALAALAERDVTPSGGLLVAPEHVESPHPAIHAMQGDHPVPGVLSFAAAGALADLAAQVHDGDDVIVLLSGGTSSLVAAPIPGIAHDDVERLFTTLLGSGADIGAMNAVRRRFLCWGAGRASPTKT